MELEEAIETYKNIKKYKKIVANIDTEFFLKFTETVLQALEENKTALEEKDKIIDLMAEELSSIAHFEGMDETVEEIKDYFRKKVTSEN